MKVLCLGGMLAGKEVEDRGEATIHQHGLEVIRVYHPYPKRRGFKVIDKLITISESYSRVETPEGPVYECDFPFGGIIEVGGIRLEKGAGGRYSVWLDREGKAYTQAPEI